MNLKEKITRKMDELKLKYPNEKINQAWLAKKTGVSKAAVSKWMDGSTHKLNGDTLIATARALECLPEWLNGSPSTDPRAIDFRPINIWGNEEELNTEDYVLIPRLRIKASCGNGSSFFEVDEHGQKQAFRKKWCERFNITPDKAATFIASGDSMNDRIYDGDSLVVDYSDNQDVVSGKVYVFVFKDEIYTKRLYRQKDSILVVSDNPDKSLFPNWEITTEEIEDFKIIGRVVALSGGI